MKLLLDSSVLLAASHSSSGASIEVIRRSAANDWQLLTTPYVLDEVERNLLTTTSAAVQSWNSWRHLLRVKNDVFTLNRLVVFDVPKDRPVLFGAVAWADVLLTLDRHDFSRLLGRSFYHLWILQPGAFLTQQRADGALK